MNSHSQGEAGYQEILYAYLRSRLKTRTLFTDTHQYMMAIAVWVLAGSPRILKLMTKNHKTAISMNGVDGSETTLEAAWSIQVTDYLGFKPDLQYVVNPSGDTAAKAAMVFSLRTEIGF